MKIDRSLRLPTSQYWKSTYEKRAVVLHHTVGGSAKSTFHWWNRTSSRIGTAYIIGRDGTVYELFDPRYWAWHLGLKGTNGYHDRRTVGIELASVGPLVYSDGDYYAFDRVTNATRYTGKVWDATTVIKDTCMWRGWRFFAEYTEEQTDSLMELLRYLHGEFHMGFSHPSDPVTTLDQVPTSGIFSHSHVRKDKSDLHPGFDWSMIPNE